MGNITPHNYDHEDSDSDEEYELGFYPLHDAAFQDDCKSISKLIRKLYEHHDINDMRKRENAIIDGINHDCNDNGETALFVAAAKGNKEAVNTLLEHVANPNISNDREITPLLKALKCRHFDCVKILLEDCIYDIGYHKIDPDIGDDTGWTPLHEACYQNLPLVVAQLVKTGADLNIMTDDHVNGVTPLFTACQYGSKECVTLLLRYGADKQLTSIHGDLPLHIACEKGQLECAIK